jgi:hypothetical protein
VSVCVPRYEREGRARRVIKAQQLWFAVLDSQVRPPYNGTAGLSSGF